MTATLLFCNAWLGHGFITFAALFPGGQTLARRLLGMDFLGDEEG